jgi:hypothetical protein
MNFTANIWYSCLHQHVQLHKVIHLSFYLAFLKISAWHPGVWHCGRSCTSTNNRRPNQAPHTLEALGQPSNAPNESTLGSSGQLGTAWWTSPHVPGLPQLPMVSCCTRSWGCQRCTPLHRVCCPLPTVCVGAPLILNPICKTYPTTKYEHQVNSSVK